jgi:hypothetical protein
VSLLVDTRVWSLALRRDSASGSPAVEALRTALEGGDTLVTTGLVLHARTRYAAGISHSSAIASHTFCSACGPGLKSGESDPRIANVSAAQWRGFRGDAAFGAL